MAVYSSRVYIMEIASRWLVHRSLKVRVPLSGLAGAIIILIVIPVASRNVIPTTEIESNRMEK